MSNSVLTRASFFSGLLLCTIFGYAQDHIRYVNPLIGTTKSAVLTHWGGNGGTYPGAVAPAGRIQISPETRVNGAKGYDYTDSSIYFFSCIQHHSGFPEGSSGELYIMPVLTDDFKAGKDHRPFSHQEEQARPGYYKVTFKDDGTVAEATAGLRTGMLRFTFPAKAHPKVFIGNAGLISMVGKRVLHDSLSNAVINFSEDLLNKRQVKGGYVFAFKRSVTGAKVVTLKLSTSTVNFAGAQHNIDQEIASIGFEGLRLKTNAVWKTQLATVDITDSSSANKTVFYTALYHSLLLPWVVSDADGKYRGKDQQVYQTRGKYEYGGFSPWDTFRSLHPLLSLLYPEKQNDIILSMLDIYQQTGHLPTETMTGNHAVPIIVDAYLKGITGYDKTLAYTAMKKNIMEAPFVQHDMEIYHIMNYVPFSNSESVTRTVEYAYNDWVLSQYAKQVVHKEQDYTILQERSLNYRNLFSPAGLFMLPRKGEEIKAEPGKSGYKEGDKWVYSYFVPHNAKDLINLFGGKAEFAERLDSALTNDVIVYDNETVLHVPYLFNAAGYPNLTQKWSREIMLKRFAAAPGGLPGNDDLGAMSSAYIFNALGIFPISPGNPLYAIGAPLFQSVKLHLAHQKTFIINAKGQSPENKYVQSLQVNHSPYEQLSIAHDVLLKGGSMEYVMSAAADESWPKDKDPKLLSQTKTDVNINILGYIVSKTKVEPNEEFWLRFMVSNKGSVGTKKIVVYLDGKPYAFKHCLVLPGATLTDSISCRLYRLGKVRLGLSAEEGVGMEVLGPVAPVLHPYLLSNLKLTPVLPLNAVQQMSYSLKNLTGESKEFHIPVSLGETVLFNDSVQLAPGETKTATHHFTAGTAGINLLHVADSKIVYKVYTSNLSSLLVDLSLVNQESSLLTDHSGLGNDAKIVGNKAGKTGNRILLGDSCFVVLNNAASLDQMGENMTMMAWVYPQANEKGLIDMLTKGDSHVLQTNNNQTLTFFAGGWGRGDCTVKLPANWKREWHHIAGTCKGDLLSVYIDGKLAGTSTVDGIVNLSQDSQWQIGRNEEFPSERIFHGYIDKVKVYEEALSPQEISSMATDEKILLKRQEE